MHQLDKHIHGPDIMSFFFFNLIPFANSMNCNLFVFIHQKHWGDKRVVLLEALILQCLRNSVDFTILQLLGQELPGLLSTRTYSPFFLREKPDLGH